MHFYEDPRYNVPYSEVEAKTERNQKTIKYEIFGIEEKDLKFIFFDCWKDITFVFYRMSKGLNPTIYYNKITHEQMLELSKGPGEPLTVIRSESTTDEFLDVYKSAWESHLLNLDELAELRKNDPIDYS